MTASRSIVAFTVVCVLAGASSRAFAQSGMAGMDHSKHRMGPSDRHPEGRALYMIRLIRGRVEHRIAGPVAGPVRC